MTERLFGGLFARGAVAGEVSDRAFLRAMLDVEVALAQALVAAGLAPSEIVEQLVAAKADAASFDLAELERSTREQGSPVPGLLRLLMQRLPAPASEHLHRGATSQDIVDTATMLAARRALEPLLADLAAAASVCAALAERHRATVMPGRTLLQQGAPTTFGLKAAGWLIALDGARSGLAEVRRRELAIQLGGAVGTLAALGDHGLEVAAAMAERLELAMPVAPWHSIRLRPARLASGLGVAAGVMGKVARDVALLAQTEVGEVREGGDAGRGASSAMPHKHNPVGAVAVLACVTRAPGLSATIVAAMPQEHERGAGGWQAEWATLAELLRLSGSAAAALRELLGGLEVDAERMRSNIVELALSESVVVALAESIGSRAARAVVEGAAGRTARERMPFREALLEAPEVRDGLGAERLDVALDPVRYLGVSDQLIDRALAAHEQDNGDPPEETR